ncbi:hypothetical protein GKZ89_00480 [Bacillus mangrovi]|uniref:Uncharacterized protein n=1 Tax=Metabacillus mangrovi TaxID=1491830 RepID=A0A7X2S286_9BACI|nr:hypothetical protein [Metabacillus mangrovi]MTH51863.1 hypothetical protein [Metabacillus mangrovi]
MNRILAVMLFFILTGYLAGQHHQVKLVEEPSVHVKEQEHSKYEPLFPADSGPDISAASLQQMAWTALLILSAVKKVKIKRFLFPVFYQSDYFSGIRRRSTA